MNEYTVIIKRHTVETETLVVKARNNTDAKNFAKNYRYVEDLVNERDVEFDAGKVEVVSVEKIGE